MDSLPMYQHRHESERSSGRDPLPRGLSALLELRGNVAPAYLSSLELYRCDQRFIADFADEYVIAPLQVKRQVERFAIKVRQNAIRRQPVH